MSGASPASSGPELVGRYAIYDAIASGGMATVHLGRLVGPGGFSRTVAIKRLHPQLAQDREVAGMLLDEARLAARIQHPNVVPTLDVVATEGQMLLVMEYVRGDSLARLLRAAQHAGARLPPHVVVAILSNALAGLHAAHEALDEQGHPLELVHRDVSPQNIMVGVDGVARVLDFGVAKAAGRLHTTREGEVKGKVLYMSREQLAGEHLTRATDIYAAGIILHEALTNTRMFAGENEVAAVTRIVANDIRVPSQIDPALAPFDAIVRRAAALDPQARFQTAREMATALEAVCPPASTATVGEWVQRLASTQLDIRARLVSDIERSATRAREVAMPRQEEAPLGPNSGVVRAQVASVPAFVGPPSGPISISQLPVSPHIPASQIPPVAPPPSGTSWVAIVVVAVSLLLASIGGVAIFLSRRAPKPPAFSTAPAAVSEAPGAPALPPIPAVPPEEAGVALPTPSAPPSDAVTAPSAAAGGSASPAAPVAKARAKAKCDPPYTVDAKGHKHFLPECIH